MFYKQCVSKMIGKQISQEQIYFYKIPEFYKNIIRDYTE